MTLAAAVHYQFLYSERANMITRRSILTGSSALLAVSSIPARAQEKPAAIRIGTQKGGFFPAIRNRGCVETAFEPLGIDIKWVDFQFGPPMLEAINVGSLDYGYVGDAPPIFAQAGGARISYAAAVISRGNNQAILVSRDSPIHNLGDLRGKKIAFGKGSSAHNLLVAALERAGIAWSDITPVPLAPADAVAAFIKGAVDAWSVWDPYVALAELRFNARAVAWERDVHESNAFYIARADFVTKYPSVVARLNDVLAAEGKWAESHHEEVAKAQADATGVDIDAVRRSVGRSVFQVSPVTDQVIETQQIVADRFYKLGLIPRPVHVDDIVWKWTPGL